MTKIDDRYRQGERGSGNIRKRTLFVAGFGYNRKMKLLALPTMGMNASAFEWAIGSSAKDDVHKICSYLNTRGCGLCGDIDYIHIDYIYMRDGGAKRMNDVHKM